MDGLLVPFLARLCPIWRPRIPPSAVAIAASTSFESLTLNSCKAVKWLLCAGCRAQQAFPILSLEPSIVQDAVDGSEGVPTPMLSVTGLSLKPLIKSANSHLPDNSKMFVSTTPSPDFLDPFTASSLVSERSVQRAAKTKAKFRTLDGVPSSPSASWLSPRRSTVST